MKYTPVLTFLSFFFFFLLFSFTNTKAELVYDSKGEPLRNGGKYDLSPPFPIGGGLISTASLTKGSSELCSLAVVQISYINGLPAIFSTLLNSPYISTDSPLRIQFADLPLTKCTTSPNWLVIKILPLGKSVMVGDVRDFPDTSIVKGSFYIKPYADNHETKSYKLVYCEKDYVCGDIGVRPDYDKNLRLVVTDNDPLEFKFDKVN